MWFSWKFGAAWGPKTHVQYQNCTRNPELSMSYQISTGGFLCSICFKVAWTLEQGVTCRCVQVCCVPPPVSVERLKFSWTFERSMIYKHISHRFLENGLHNISVTWGYYIY